MPAPDVTRPREIWKFIRLVVSSFAHHHGFHYAAAIAFRATLAIFPMIVASLAFLSASGAGQGFASEVLQQLADTGAVPSESVDAVQGQLDSLEEPGPFQLLGGILAFALGVWSAAAAIRTCAAALNEIFGINEQRSAIERFVISLALAFSTAVFSVVPLFFVVFGDGWSDQFEGPEGSIDPLEIIADGLRWALTAVSVFAWFSLIYALAPADRHRLRFVTPGVVVAFLGWSAFAFLFSAYVDGVSDNRGTYGGFAGLIVLQLYCYWTAIILLIGAEIDREIGNRGNWFARRWRKFREK